MSEMEASMREDWRYTALTDVKEYIKSMVSEEGVSDILSFFDTEKIFLDDITEWKERNHG